MSPNIPVGAITWYDLTVPDASSLRDFYSAVVGWIPSPVAMGGYDDYCMNRPSDGTAAAGVCHARGVNADLPPVWLAYVTVANLKASLDEVTQRGGSVVVPVREMGDGRMAVIRDPAGAVLGLYEVINSGT